MRKFFSHVLRHPYALLPNAPKGIIYDARHWIKQKSQEHSIDLRWGKEYTYWEQDEETIRILPPPQAIFSEQNAQNHPIISKIQLINKTALFMLRNCSIIGREGTILSPENFVFAEFTYANHIDISKHSIFKRRKFPQLAHLKGNYATLCYPSSFAYFHWLVESLPRLRYIETYISSLDGLFIPANVEPSILESLELCGVTRSQIIPLDMQSYYQPEILLIPQYCSGLNLPTWVSEYLKQKILKKDYQDSLINQQSAKRVFISRQDASKRRITNEHELENILTEFNFVKVELRKLTFLEQAKLFASAEIVVAPHGAGLANVLFCNAGVKVLELLPCHSISPHLFHSITTSVMGSYYYLYGNPQSTDNSNIVHSDFSIKHEDFRLALEYLVSR